MGFLLTALPLVFLLMGSCSPQNILDSIRLTLATVAEQQNQILQKFDEQEAKMNTQQTMIQEIQIKITTIEEQQERVRSLEQSSTRDNIYSLLDLHVIDECAAAGSNNCSEMATCIDTLGRYKCTCLPGYSGNGFICEDVDECRERPNACNVDQICTNLPGNYNCTCYEGYKKQGNSCQDINECEEDVHLCHNDATCTNTPGNYTCQCLQYYEGDGYICNDINECEEDVHECNTHATCTNNVGQIYTCRCFLGYVGDGYTCVSDCNSPSHQIVGLGCIIPVKEKKTWDDAQDNCRKEGARLVEGIRPEHITMLRQHFYEYIGRTWVHIGIRGGKWVTSRDPISPEDAIWINGHPKTGKDLCGQASLPSPSDNAIGEYDCSEIYPYLCQRRTLY